MSTNGQATKEKDPDVAASFSCLTHDAIELAELQAQLLAIDAKAASRAVSMSVILAVVAICLLLGAVPVMLLAVGDILAEVFGWPHWGAMSAAAVLGLALSAIAGLVAWYRLRTGFAPFQRSREELHSNLAWIKTNLKRNKPRMF